MGGSKAEEERKNAEDQLTNDLKQWINIHLGAWRDALDLALPLVKPPEEKERSYWWLALVGNLGWAMTAFFPPLAMFRAASLVTQARWTGTVSVVGAVLGSGTTDIVAKSGDTAIDWADIKARLAKNAVKVQERLRLGFEAQVPSWVKDYALEAEFGKDAVTAADLDRWTWRLMFPSILFNVREDALLARMWTDLEFVMEEYRHHFRAWDKKAKQCGADRLTAGEKAAGVHARPIYETHLAKCRTEIPFKSDFAFVYVDGKGYTLEQYQLSLSSYAQIVSEESLQYKQGWRSRQGFGR
jgi:hypothetical protein